MKTSRRTVFRKADGIPDQKYLLHYPYFILVDFSNRFTLLEEVDKDLRRSELPHILFCSWCEKYTFI